MTEKTIFKWLEKLFAREVNLSLKIEKFPLQLPKKQALYLIDLGLAEEVEFKKGPFIFKFHLLTDEGRYQYCSKC